MTLGRRDWARCAVLAFLSATIAVGVRADVAEDLASSRQNAIVRAIERAGPAVVNINSTQIVRQRVFSRFWNLYNFRGFEEPRYRERRLQSLGSGSIFDARRGYVLTNQHVIDDADEVRVRLQDGRVFEATVVGADEFTDVAVLQIDAEDLPEVPLGSSEELRIGEWAIAIGNPFGQLVRDLNPTVTVGVISATNRVVRIGDRTYNYLVQTDASVNPGNSGGPLINAAGEVIGINTFIFTESGGSHGVNFAIAIDVVKKVVADLIRHGRVVEPWIGLTYTEAADDGDGVLVTYVEPGSPAEDGGVHSGDVVTLIDREHVYDVNNARRILRLVGLETRVGLTLTRDSAPRTATLVTGHPRDNYSFFGARVQVSPRTRAVMVRGVESGSVFDDVLQEGDRLVSIGRAQIRTIEGLRALAAQIRPRMKLRLVFQRRRQEFYYDFLLS